MSIKTWMSAFRQDGAGSEQAFDNLASSLAGETISRRRALQLAGATVLASAGLGLAAREAEARPNCNDVRVGCNRCCRGTDKRCVCLRHVDGGKRCVYQCCPRPGEFGGAEELVCDENAECPSDRFVCIKRGTGDQPNCCPELRATAQDEDERGICMIKCRTENPIPDECAAFGESCRNE